MEPQLVQKPEFAKAAKDLILKACKEAVSDILDLSDSSSHDSKRKYSRRH